MDILTARNPHSSLPGLLMMLYGNSTRKDDMMHLRGPMMVTWECPAERVMFWPGLKQNPAQELALALGGVAKSGDLVKGAVSFIEDKKEGFLFSTSNLVGEIALDGDRLDMLAITSEKDPFLGAFGQLGMQLTFLHELMALGCKKKQGTLTIQHTKAITPAPHLTKLLLSTYEDFVPDPYESGTKHRGLDRGVQSDLPMFASQKQGAMGYQSQWIRRVAVPTVQTIGDHKMVKNIKADDWRLAMERWIDGQKEAS